MTKTVIIPDDVHILIVKKQIYIRENYGVNLRITDMLVAYIKDSIGRTEDLLNIKTPKTKENDYIKTSRDIDISLVEEKDVRF